LKHVQTECSDRCAAPAAPPVCAIGTIPEATAAIDESNYSKLNAFYIYLTA
jgi:hypothetical protein